MAHTFTRLFPAQLGGTSGDERFEPGAGLFPAHAGVILKLAGMAQEAAAIPRTCGGDPWLSTLRLV